MGRVFHVNNLVNCQSPGLTKTFTASVTLVRLLFRMDVTMVSQMVLSSKGLVTNLTAIRTLIRVGSLMDQEVV